ncbi:MAG: Spy/CpxP family protein refolding chaperone [Gemmatimonadaceae bacterium]
MKLRLALAALTAVLLAGATVPAHAQGGAPPDSRPGRGGMMGNQQRMIGMLFQGITLTADQQARVKAVRATFQPRMDSIRAEMRGAARGAAPDPAMRARMTTLDGEQRAALRAILTADQRKQFDENVARMPQRGGGRPPMRGAPPARD